MPGLFFEEIMAANKKLLIVAGDGIGPEVMTEVKRVIGWFDKRQGLSFDVDQVGGMQSFTATQQALGNGETVIGLQQHFDDD